MNAAEYEIAAAKFAAANRTWNRARRAFEAIASPTDADRGAYDSAELTFMRAEREHKAAYAAHASASPDTSEEVVAKDGKRSPLTPEEIAARDRAQAVAEVRYWPAMKDTAEDLTGTLTPEELAAQSAAHSGEGE